MNLYSIIYSGLQVRINSNSGYNKVTIGFLFDCS